MDSHIKKDLLDYFYSFITPNKQEIFQRVIQKRTRYLTVVFQDIYQSHNASAVLRSCDITGVQDVHIIENRNEFKLSKDVALGASKWLNLYKYTQEDDNTKSALQLLKSKGYKIVATTPHRNDYILSELPITQRMAILFGTELKGLTDEAMEEADVFVQIPMHGFTESFNISVSAAIIMYHLSEKIRSSEVNWQLSEAERLNILLDWARKVVNRPEALERSFFKKNAMIID